jgi:hypothetical protein
VVARFSAAASTVRLWASVATSLRSPSKDAFVAPAIVALGSITWSDAKATEALVTVALAWLWALAVTETAAPGAVIEDDDPTDASVSASGVMSASASVPAAAMAPAVDDDRCRGSTVLFDVAPIEICEASVTSPSKAATVAPPTVAVGRLMVAATTPPDAAEEVAGGRVRRGRGHRERAAEVDERRAADPGLDLSRRRRRPHPRRCSRACPHP